ncbi:uncharacterized protein LOC131619803 [Vicia villosa]|uniref:uncharacterized protein LOC131619803 n=1 Tax=Vicia villosa TaxID=3911 RepID=UPI00273C9C49|nr:uncharacterized protein LOC131619803 [Vicia villosa]
MENVEGIRSEIFKVFMEKFKEEVVERPIMKGVGFRCISEGERLSFETKFSEEEIQAGVLDSDRDKSPGPDGINFKFIHECWEFLEKDIDKFVQEFYLNACLLQAITTSFIVLIPKNFNPQGLNEFKPICLVGCLYKILSMILAN